MDLNNFILDDMIMLYKFLHIVFFFKGMFLFLHVVNIWLYIHNLVFYRMVQDIRDLEDCQVQNLC